MNSQLVEEGLRNMERLRQMMAIAEDASPKLKRRMDRFRKNLHARQERNISRIMSRPDTKAYREFVETSKRFHIPIPSASMADDGNDTLNLSARAD